MTTTPIKPVAAAIEQARRRRLIHSVLGEALAARPADAYACVYAFADADAVSVYVGSTDNIDRRLKQHLPVSTWLDFAAAGVFMWTTTLGAARMGEAALIAERQPMFNIRDNAPGARARLVRYLVAHDRLDLLTPTIKLG